MRVSDRKRRWRRTIAFLLVEKGEALSSQLLDPAHPFLPNHPPYGLPRQALGPDADDLTRIADSHLDQGGLSGLHCVLNGAGEVVAGFAVPDSDRFRDLLEVWHEQLDSTRSPEFLD